MENQDWKNWRSCRFRAERCAAGGLVGEDLGASFSSGRRVGFSAMAKVGKLVLARVRSSRWAFSGGNFESPGW